MERQTTIKKLFHEEGIQFAIPAYQRAYSWEVDSDRKQVQQFIEDIQEHIGIRSNSCKVCAPLEDDGNSTWNARASKVLSKQRKTCGSIAAP